LHIHPHTAKDLYIADGEVTFVVGDLRSSHVVAADRAMKSPLTAPKAPVRSG
jgi:hypothetical protein